MTAILKNYSIHRSKGKETRQGRIKGYRNTLFRKLILPWLILLSAITVILAGMNFYQIGQINDMSLSNTVSESTRTLSNCFLSTIRQAESIVDIIRMSNQTKELHDAEKSGVPSVLAVTSYEYMQFLNSLKVGYPAADSIWIVENGYIYSSDRTRYEIESEQMSSILSYYSEAWIPFFNPGSVCSGTIGAEKTLTYVGSIPSIDGRLDTRVLINVGIPRLVTELKRYCNLDGFIVQNKNGETIISSEMASDIPDDAASVFKKANYVWAQMSDSGYTFYGLILAEAGTGMIKLQLIYSAVLAILLLVMVVVVYVLISRRVYASMDNLFGHFQTSSLTMDVETTHAVRESLKLMKDDYLSTGTPEKNIIHDDTFETNENQVSLQVLNKLKITGSYIVMTLGIDEPMLLREDAEKLMPHFEKLIRLFSQQIICPDEEVYTFCINDYLVTALIRLNSDDRFATSEEIMSSLQKMLYSVSSCTVSIGCSCLHKSQEDIPAAVTEAMRAIGTKMKLSPGCHVFYEESMDNPECFIFPKAKFQRLVLALEQKETGDINKLYHELISSATESGASADNLMMIYYQILGKIIQIQLKNKIPVSSIFGEASSSPYRYMATMEFSNHISEWLEEKIMLLKECLAEMYPAGNVYINRFMEYMKMHYMEAILPEDVASTLGISYSYLRKLLSKDLNTTFSNVLLNLRITRVKELLISTQLSHKEIAKLVGLGSEQTLYRIFRQQEGCSPGEWRHTATESLNIENKQQEGNV